MATQARQLTAQRGTVAHLETRLSFLFTFTRGRPSSVVKGLWGVFVCGFVGRLGCVVSCRVCVCVGGVVLCVCVCDLLIFLHEDDTRQRGAPRVNKVATCRGDPIAHPTHRYLRFGLVRFGFTNFSVGFFSSMPLCECEMCGASAVSAGSSCECV